MIVSYVLQRKPQDPQQKPHFIISYLKAIESHWWCFWHQCGYGSVPLCLPRSAATENHRDPGPTGIFELGYIRVGGVFVCEKDVESSKGVDPYADKKNIISMCFTFSIYWNAMRVSRTF